MKTELEMKRSRDARLNQVIAHAADLKTLAEQQRVKFYKTRMAEMRGVAEQLLQCIHEYSAYHNALAIPDELKPNDPRTHLVAATL